MLQEFHIVSVKRIFSPAKWKVLHVPGRYRESIFAGDGANLRVPQVKMFPPVGTVRRFQFRRIPAPFCGGWRVEVQKMAGVILRQKLKCSLHRGFAFSLRQPLYPITNFSQRDRGQHALTPPRRQPCRRQEGGCDRWLHSLPGGSRSGHDLQLQSPLQGGDHWQRPDHRPDRRHQPVQRGRLGYLPQRPRSQRRLSLRHPHPGQPRGDKQMQEPWGRDNRRDRGQRRRRC